MAVAVAVLVTGCGSGGSRPPRHPPGTPFATAALGPGTHPLALKRAETTRIYRLHVPARRPHGPRPLVIALHSAGLDGAVLELISHLDSVSDGGGFFVAYPDGINHVWNAGDCCGLAMTTGVDDVGFLAALIGTLARTQDVDRRRVYVTGISNGAMMALRMACQRPDLFAAVATVAGSLTYQPCRPSLPVPLMNLHGSADQAVPEQGGIISGLGMRRPFPSQREMIEIWSRIDGVPVPSQVTYSRGDTTCRSSPDDMILDCRIQGGGHTWPGGSPVADAGRTSTDIDASASIWSFFARHKR